MGFWARVKNLPAVSAFFSLLPISEKSGGSGTSSSLRDLFLLGVWLLSFALFKENLSALKKDLRFLLKKSSQASVGY